MASYVIVGASRGLGLEWVRQLSEDKANKVFAIVRNLSTATKLAQLAASSSNIIILKGDLVDSESLKVAAAEVGKQTDGKLDYLINNAAVYTYSPHSLHTFPTDSELEEDLVDKFRTNVVGVAFSTNAFLPLLRAGSTKRVITLTTGLAATDMILRSGLTTNVGYPVSKAALNMVVAQYAAALKPEGFTFLAISPGLVNTAEKPPTPEEVEGYKDMVAKLQKHSPHWDGVPLTPESSVRMMRGVIENASVEDSGAFISQFGNQQWL